MPIDRIAIGKNLYLFQSRNPQSEQCVIIGHGGRVADVDERTTMPADTRTHFYTTDGNEVLMNTAAAIALVREGRMVQETIGPGVESWDYQIQKYNGHGKHGVSYLEARKQIRLNGECADSTWQPHVVTIRNRTLAKRTVHLSDVIREVQQRYGHIREFHYTACRGVERRMVRMEPTGIGPV